MKRKQKITKSKKIQQTSKWLQPKTILIALATIAIAVIALTASRASSPITKSERFGISAGGGLQYLSSTDLARELDTMKQLGAKWVRFDFVWSDIQSGGRNSYNWSRYDAVVAAANARGLRVLGILGYTPTWARPSTCTGSDKCAPANPDDFGVFARAAAQRYTSQGVNHWEIWNEPNIVNFWQPQPNVLTYAALLKSGYTNIKSVNVNATILTGGTSPAATGGGNISPTDFATGIYANGGKNYFDALAHHPYCYAGTFDCPTTYAAWSAWSQMSQTPISLRSIMTSNGDASKQIWATEFGAPTSGDGAVSESQQAQMVTKAYQIFNSYTWSGPLFWYSARDAGTNVADREHWFGLQRYDRTQKPAYNAYIQAVKSIVGTATPTPTPTITPAPTIIPTVTITPTPTPAITPTPVQATAAPATVTPVPTTPTLTTPVFTGFSLSYNWWQGCGWDARCSIAVSWSSVAGATGYEVVRSGKPNVQTSATSYIESPVYAGGSYTFQVIAKNGTQSAINAAVTKRVSCTQFIFSFCGVQ